MSTPTLQRAALLAALALPALGGCQHLQAVLEQDAQRGMQNLVSGTLSGELSKEATLDMEQEFQVGRTIAASVVARLGGRALPPEHPAARYVRSVGSVVALAAADLRRPEDRPYPLHGYRFVLVDSPAVNAAGTPGGFVVVTTGALRGARDEDELAAVLAHEVAHVQRGHTTTPIEEARKRQHQTQVVTQGMNGLTQVLLAEVSKDVTARVLDQGLGHDNELAADAFAARILVAAGYDGRALERALRRLEGAAAGGGGKYFSRHPPAAERAERLAALDLEAPPAPAEVRAPRLTAVKWTLGGGKTAVQ